MIRVDGDWYIRARTLADERVDFGGFTLPVALLMAFRLAKRPDIARMKIVFDVPEDDGELEQRIKWLEDALGRARARIAELEPEVSA